MYERKDGDIIIFSNDQKGNDRAPKWKGKLLLNGEELEVALWEKHGQKGIFLTGNAKPPRQSNTRAHQNERYTPEEEW